MPSYIVERYVPNLTAESVKDVIRRERAAMVLIAAAAGGVEHVRTTYLPDDELCMALYVGPSADEVRRANERAKLPFDRISEAIEVATEDAECQP
jgi:hypothetical protein